jgi:hypothetical protein
MQYSLAALEQRLVDLGSVNVGYSRRGLIEYHLGETTWPRIPERCNVSRSVPMVRIPVHGHGHEGIRESGDERGNFPENVYIRIRIGVNSSRQLTK